MVIGVLVVGDEVWQVDVRRRRHEVRQVVMRRRGGRRPVARLHRAVRQRPLALAHAAVRVVLPAVAQLLARAGVRVRTRSVVDRRTAAAARSAAASELVLRLRRRQRWHSTSAQIPPATELRLQRLAFASKASRPSPKRTLLEHKLRGRIYRPVVTLSRSPEPFGELHETFVQAEVVPDGVLPALVRAAEERELLLEERVDLAECESLVGGVSDGHDDEGYVGEGWFLLSSGGGRPAGRLLGGLVLDLHAWVRVRVGARAG